MNEDVCDFVLRFLDKAHVPGNAPSPASLFGFTGDLIRKEVLSYQACHLSP